MCATANRKPYSMIEIEVAEFKNGRCVDVLFLKRLHLIMFESLRLVARYLWKTKKWWLVPALLMLVIIGLLILISAAAPVPIFVYPLI